MIKKNPLKFKTLLSFFTKVITLLFLILWLYVALSAVLDFELEPTKSQVVLLLQTTVLFFILKEFARFLKTYKRNLKITFSIWLKFSWSIFFQSVLVAGGTLMISLFLVRIPIFSKGWTHLFFKKGGSIMTSFIQLESISFSYVLTALTILILFILIIPHFALLEELAFRKGKLSIPKRIVSSIIFGLVHMIMGIPLGASIALMFTGYFYSAIYASSFKRHLDNSNKESHNIPRELIISRAELIAMRESSVYHTMVNTILFGTIILLLIPLLFF